MARTKKSSKKKTIVLKTPTECTPVIRKVFLYGTPDLQHTLYEKALTAPKPFVISFGNISYSEEDIDGAKVCRCAAWKHIDSVLETLEENKDSISTIVVNNLVTAYDSILRRVLYQNKVIYPSSRDIWTEALYRMKTFLYHIGKLRKNVIVISGSKEIYIGDEVNNALFIRPSISESLLASLISTYDCVLFMYKEGKKKPKLVLSGEAPVNNWYLASCKSPTMKENLSLDFSSFLNAV